MPVRTAAATLAADRNILNELRSAVTITTVGRGVIGGGLGRRWARAGQTLTVTNAHPGRVEQFLADEPTLDCGTTRRTGRAHD
jgi:hypothetical protein